MRRSKEGNNSWSNKFRSKRSTRNFLGPRDESGESFGPSKFRQTEEGSENADNISINKSKLSRESKRSLQK